MREGNLSVSICWMASNSLLQESVYEAAAR